MRVLPWCVPAVFLAAALAFLVATWLRRRAIARERRILTWLRWGESAGAEIGHGTDVGRGVLYVVLASMEERGLIVHRAEVVVVGNEIEQWKRVYRLTDKGRAMVTGHR